jgi:hypothetical protein
MGKKIVEDVRDYPGRLYIEIPREIRQKAGLSSGDELVCFFEKVLDARGKVKAEVKKEVTWEVGEFPYMLIVPREVSEHHDITPGGFYEDGDKLELTIEKIKKKDGSTMAV